MKPEEDPEQLILREVAVDTLLNSRAGIGTVLIDIARGRRLYRQVGTPRLRIRPAALAVAMFDVFDTLVTRSTIDSESAWRSTAALLRMRGEAEIADEHYVEARRRAENTASVQFRDCATLEEIHRQLAVLLSWPEEAWTTSSRAEVDVERQVSRPVTAGRSMLDAARSHGLRILFVSDMHLPSVVIRSILQDHGCWSDGDELWVSSEARARKKTGELFLDIARTNRFELSSAVHVGDQPLADRIAPRWVGARPVAIATAEPNRYERLLARADLPGRLGERLAGAAREVRVGCDGEYGTVDSVAADVVGPTLVSYALWLLAEADRRGLVRLYFLSRDGEILQQVTEAVARGLGIDTEMRYLYGGRMAWRLPSLDHASESEWGRFFDDLLRPTVVTAEGLARRTGLQIDDVTTLVGDSGALRLDHGARLRLRSEIDRRSLREVIAANAHSQRLLVRRYFEQERLATADKIAVVDVGWMGHTMRSLAALLQPTAPPLSLFFAWGGTEALPGGQDAYLWGGGRADLWERMPSVAAHIEMFCSGSHGGVAGYRDVGGRIEPQLLGQTSAAAASFPVERMQRTVVSYADLVASTLHRDDRSSDTRSAIADLLALFREQPSRVESTTWGELTREEDPQGDSTFPMARPFRLDDIPRVLRPGPFAGRNLTWPEGALARTRQPLRAVVAGALWGAGAARSLRLPRT